MQRSKHDAMIRPLDNKFAYLYLKGNQRHINV